ncbi:pseudouridine-5'-phosphate glycosidase [Aquicella lusitana]|uniref:Pseudouridine-5'-phosphate glycosidase n=1 Tax=Aquicella lusitana TaxID=254246 RepID=A0A370GS99_9COXI|nr:pseudouridine-5'-phosphate glycosidase [Aquicella lusitana]RDI46572.1 pseudouridine-5'-phosphate glycosidase [Aquicella lusitana]VVC74236.1 Pseudouridine-5'-phosphate glycosidase [Aquicella lusitana]
MQQFFEYSTEVREAMQAKKPVLALESTLITHGLPFPQNIETAMVVEQIARDHDVTPATIAIMQGKVKIGLSSSELETLVYDSQRVKASQRDIPYVLSMGLNAGTTVASTLFCAHHAGIKIFATGGIGGVHRGDDQDISADLIELSRTPLALVCAGAKAILDLSKTMELMETLSIPVVGYRTEYLPAFYSSTSPYSLPIKVDDLAALVKLLQAHWQLNLSAGMLIANPIPVEDEIPAEIIEPVISAALKKAEQQHIRGKAITPFLLNEVRLATQGQSLQTNIQLIKNNVKLGAELAKALGNLN